MVLGIQYGVYFLYYFFPIFLFYFLYCNRTDKYWCQHKLSLHWPAMLGELTGALCWNRLESHARSVRLTSAAASSWLWRGARIVSAKTLLSLISFTRVPVFYTAKSSVVNFNEKKITLRISLRFYLYKCFLPKVDCFPKLRIWHYKSCSWTNKVIPPPLYSIYM